MTKRDVKQFPFGSPQYVVAHAKWRGQRGKRPSMAFADIGNPAKALSAAKACLERSLKLSIRGWWHELRRTKLPVFAKEALAQAIRVFRQKAEESPETTPAQFAEIVVGGVGSLELNGTRLGLALQAGRLVLEPIS